MPQPLILYKVIPNTQKAVAAAGGFALTKAGMALPLSPTYIALYNLAYPIASIMLLAFNFLNMLLRWVSMVFLDRCSSFSISLIVNPWAERRRTVFSASVSVILPVINHWFTLMSYSMISPVTTLCPEHTDPLGIVTCRQQAHRAQRCSVRAHGAVTARDSDVHSGSS